MTLRRLVTMLGVVLMLASCGQRGPLYMPGDPPPKRRLGMQIDPSPLPLPIRSL